MIADVIIALDWGSQNEQFEKKTQPRQSPTGSLGGNTGKFMKRWLGQWLMALVLGGMKTAVAAATSYYVYQGGVSRGTIAPYVDNNETGTSNYGYDGNSANLVNGPTLSDKEAHLFLFSGSDGLHFTVVFNNGSGRAGGAEFSLALTGNGSSASVQVSDDASELTGSGNSFTGDWSWGGAYTDGGVIGPLSGAAWTLTITPTRENLAAIVAYSGDGSSINLALGTGSDYAIVITPVPEPWATGAVSGLALLGVAARRRFRARAARKLAGQWRFVFCPGLDIHHPDVK